MKAGLTCVDGWVPLSYRTYRTNNRQITNPHVGCGVTEKGIPSLATYSKENHPRRRGAAFSFTRYHRRRPAEVWCDGYHINIHTILGMARVKHTTFNVCGWLIARGGV